MIDRCRFIRLILCFTWKRQKVFLGKTLCSFWHRTIWKNPINKTCLRNIILIIINMWGIWTYNYVLLRQHVFLVKLSAVYEENWRVSLCLGGGGGLYWKGYFNSFKGNIIYELKALFCSKENFNKCTNNLKVSGSRVSIN